jgi:nitrogen-specific signal transduction histidine kinase
VALLPMADDEWGHRFVRRILPLLGIVAVGIPEDIRDKIFDPFFTTKESGRGTGQGLAIAHSVVVDKHGGTLTFASEVGKGTTFFIRLPLDESKALTARAVSA